MLTLLLVATASATWSIVATDADTSEVGGAGTSCVGSLDVHIIYGSVPGVGAVHAQAQINTAGRDEAVRLLGTGEAPADILAAISDAGFDGNAARRQYGVVDLQGRAAGYTGDANGAWAGDVQGSVGAFTYTAQGNILTGEDVVSGTAAAFEADGCDLADRLMRGLEAGAATGGGDSRCTGRGIPSDSAFVHVQASDGADIVRLGVTDTSPESAVVALRAAYDAWRLDNACPEVDTDTDGDTADTDTDTDVAGCGCTTGGGAAWPALLLPLLVSMRRARVRRPALGSEMPAHPPSVDAARQ